MTDFDALAEDMLEPGLYQKVIAEFDKLANKPGASINLVGLRAWEQLPAQQRSRDWPHVLGVYVLRVMEEENSKRTDREARDTTRTYLGDHDVASLSDSLHSVREFLGHGIDVNVNVNAEALANVLAELELLQHRVAMLRNQDGDQ
ncbi:hypothetical protein [Streptacidiphilus sp. PAMC 29251]